MAKPEQPSSPAELLNASGCRRIRSKPSSHCSAASCSISARGIRSPTSSRPDDLYRADHRLIFSAVAALVERNQPPDAVTVSEHLQRLGQLEAAGGLPYLARLVEDTPSAANIRAYAHIVRDNAMLRQLIEIGGDIAASAHATEGLTAPDIVDRAEQRVFEIAERGLRRGSGFVSLKQILPKTIDRLDFLSHSTSEITGVFDGLRRDGQDDGGAAAR